MLNPNAVIPSDVEEPVAESSVDFAASFDSAEFILSERSESNGLRLG